MALAPQVSVWDLWSESARHSETLGDPLFLECLEAASNNRIFDDLTDDKLKITLSIINSLLNDPKTKPKGLSLFSDLASQINPSRLIGFQDAVISSLHLVVKGLESPLASTALATFLPKCRCMSEVNQVVTSSIVPKVLSHFVEENQVSFSQRSFEEFALLKVCLMEYHGPCGNFKEKLEKNLIPIVDCENNELIQVVSEVMPLVSYAGGGGNAGEKHIKDWNMMLTKYLKTAYSTLLQMYGDSCSTLERENIFDGELMTGLKRITESQVLLRLSLLKRRLQNLLTIISGYLRFPFPAPKLVPQKGILKLVACLTSAIPLSATRSTLDKSQSKENVFLFAITPSVHVMALHLLDSLLYCVGSNIFTEGEAVEQIISSELKWLQEKPRAFEKVKLKLYDTLTVWLALTGGNVTNLKTLALWVNAVGVDSRVEKDVVELKVLSKPKPGKSVKLMSTSSMTLSSGINAQVFVQKSSDICQSALNTLTRIIPAIDAQNHKKIYDHLLKTASIICQLQCPPSPYDSPECRKLVYKNLTALCHNPHPQSPVSIALVATLLRRGLQDPTSLVSSFCANQISQLERLLHPTSSPLILAGPAPHPVILDNCAVADFTTSEREMEISSGEVDTSFQSESIDNTRTGTADHVGTLLNQDNLLAVLKEKMEETLKDLFASHSVLHTLPDGRSMETNSNSQPLSFTVQEASNTTDILMDHDSNEVIAVMSDDNDDDDPVVIANGNGFHLEENDGRETCDKNQIYDDNLKRKADSVDDDGQEMSKKIKANSPCKQTATASVEIVDGPSVEEMLSTFVDVEPVA